MSECRSDGDLVNTVSPGVNSVQCQTPRFMAGLHLAMGTLRRDRFRQGPLYLTGVAFDEEFWSMQGGCTSRSLRYPDAG
jgi:hypothetical protein